MPGRHARLPPGRPGADLGPRQLPALGLDEAPGAENGLSHHVDQHPTDRQADPAQLRHHVHGLLRGHLPERSTSMIDSAWSRTGPTRARPATCWLTLRKRATRPVGGASTTTASYRAPSDWDACRAWQILPVRNTSRSPGAMVVTKSRTPSLPRAHLARPRW